MRNEARRGSAQWRSSAIRRDVWPGWRHTREDGEGGERPPADPDNGTPWAERRRHRGRVRFDSISGPSAGRQAPSRGGNRSGKPPGRGPGDPARGRRRHDRSTTRGSTPGGSHMAAGINPLSDVPRGSCPAPTRPSGGISPWSNGSKILGGPFPSRSPRAIGRRVKGTARPANASLTRRRRGRSADRRGRSASPWACPPLASPRG